MQVSLLAGIEATKQAEFALVYPTNLEPVLIDTKISKGQLRATAGAVQKGTGPGIDRGGIWWRDSQYRVMGTKLVRIANDVVTQIGDVGGEGPCGFDYSFDRLGIRSGQALWYYDGANLTQVTDPDLGPVVDAMWIDGFWMTTDGDHIIVTELSDPFQILPLKYGSVEEDPDMVTALKKVRNEPYWIGRHTIQVGRNVGGNGFPFATVQGATIPYGCVSATANCYYGESFAFVGSARNEGLRVFVAGQGTATAISTRTIEDALAAEVDPESIILESRTWRGEERLFVHLAAETWVFCAAASAGAQQPVWYRAETDGGPYRPRNAIDCNGTIYVGDVSSAAFGVLTDDTDLHFGVQPGWSFDAGLLFNEGKGAIVHSVELIGLAGFGEVGGEYTMSLSLTRDGRSWSVERFIGMGKPGQTTKRLQWRPHSKFTNYMGMRFRGSGGRPGFARCEVQAEGLAA